jgi:hypothetical protein
MMLRVTSIDHIQPFEITCSLNNGIKRKIEVMPLIQQHHHLIGISALLESPQFLKAEIGNMGEIRWRNIILGADGQLWDYDISPEFVFHHGVPIAS